MNPRPGPGGAQRRATLDEDAIAAVVDLFYTRVRADPDLGPVFAGRLAEGDWPAHLATIRAFWSSVMLGSGRYKGNPFGAHLQVDGIRPELFGRWLDLFGRTCRDVLAPELAADMYGKAVRIGESLKAGLFFRPEDPAPAGAPPAAAPTAPARRGGEGRS